MDIALSTREATLNDLTKIKQIIGLSFPRFFRFFASQSVDAEEGKVLVATVQGIVVGFVKLIEFPNWQGQIRVHLVDCGPPSF